MQDGARYTAAQKIEHMQNAGEFAVQLCAKAEARGLTGYELAQSLAQILAARNPSLAGKVLAAADDALNKWPVKPS